MHAHQLGDARFAPAASTARAVTALLVHERQRDMPAVAIPRAETQLVVRFGPLARNGLDVHAMGPRLRVHRKLIPAGHWSVTARLGLATQQAVLGVPAAQLAGRVIALEDLWGEVATRRLLDRLAHARGPAEAVTVMDSAIDERLKSVAGQRSNTQLAVHAAAMLDSVNVNSVAVDLGVSDRHLRRIFRETLGVSPKTFAKLARFRRALDAARAREPDSWASIAAATGYYDQAHLIAEFRAIAGVTPAVLLRELRASAVP